MTKVKIHPAIGVARVGNSPDDFFIGPERLWEVPDPPGGFKDTECRVKRQAARFRVFAYHDNGTVEELTAAEADISWTVHLVNKKATHAGNFGASDAEVTIDPGPRTLDGPDQRAQFDTGQIKLPGASPVTVPLGEIRTDDDGHLLVLGGFGKSASPTGTPLSDFHSPGWYDDISDGPVTAHVKINATGEEFDAAGAWVLVTPPKFAPALAMPTSLWDRIFEMASEQTPPWVAAPAVPSYTDDIYPILRRAAEIDAVYKVIPDFGGTDPHAFVHPVYADATRHYIFGQLADPAGGGGDMPKLQGEAATLTKLQYGVMAQWDAGNFARDWAGPPAPAANITPDDLDRAALTNCVGAAFYPGIEAGGDPTKPIIDPGNYVGAADPLRLNAVPKPGDMSQYMALPWQGDFTWCSDLWWPVPRPNYVTRGGQIGQSWTAGIVASADEMVTKWSQLGFVVDQGGQFVEVDRCDTASIYLVTPHLAFQDVPRGPMGMSRKTALAITFEVISPAGAVTLQVNAGDGPSHARLTLPATSVTVGPTPTGQIATARLWVIYETGRVGESITDQVKVTDPTIGATWMITISANTVARKVAAAALVLDRSGSMSEDRGDGQSKHQSVVEAGGILVDVMLEGDAIGVVAFNDTAQVLESVTTLGAAGDPFDPGRLNTKNTISGPGLTPGGSTSIGDGIIKGRGTLNAAAGTFDVKSLVVLTDGVENTPPWIADAAGQLDARTYAIGLGTPQNTSAAALQTISGNTGGYLLLTGAISGDNRFLLQKYFLQILAGISNAEIVLDPQGELIIGREQRIPFLLTEADSGVDVILLTSYPQYVDFRLQTPNGFILEPWRAASSAGMVYSQGDANSFYRIVLPVELMPARFETAGTWHALLTIGRPRTQPPGRVDVMARGLFEQARSAAARSMRAPAQSHGEFAAAMATHGEGRGTLPYSLVVHSYSNLSFRAGAEQASFEPGASVTLHATLAESGMPPRPGAAVWAEIACPDGTQATVALAEAPLGSFSSSFATTTGGIYRIRVRASGASAAGHPFRREQTLTAAVWRGGDRDGSPGAGGRDGAGADGLGELLCCLLEHGVLTPALERRMQEAGIDVGALRHCIEQWCRKSKARRSE
jgi:hypothetical protein